MVRLIINIFLIALSFSVNAQQYLTKSASISFFSEAPLEDISAVNTNVSAVYDDATKQLVFQLNVADFIFPKPLMQEHFNENYLETDKFPKASFSGIIAELIEGATATGTLKIHGVENKVEVKGSLEKLDDSVIVNAIFVVQLKDYKIKIPRVVMYNIAEEIEITVKAELKKI